MSKHNTIYYLFSLFIIPDFHFILFSKSVSVSPHMIVIPPNVVKTRP